MKAKGILFLLTTALLLLSCGKPQVRHTAISGEANNIEIWRIDCTSSLQEITLDSVLLKDNDKESFDRTAEEYSRKYLEKVKSDLVAKGFVISDSPEVREKIHLELEWKNRKDIDDTDRSKNKPDPFRKREENLKRQGKRTDDSLSVDPGPLLRSLFGKNFYVDEISISIHDRDQKSLGEIYIVEDRGDHIEPEFTAGVIEKIITEGKY